MAQIRDIKERIDSVKKTKKITQAMKMVAAAKFKRASKRIQKSRRYLNELELLLSYITDKNIDPESPYFSGNTSQKHLLILITGDRGLCGGFNRGISREMEQYIKESHAENHI